MSASWFLVSMFLIWIFGSRLIRSNNQSSATLWVLETCLIVGLLPLMIILITASLSTKTYNKASWCEDWTFEGTQSILFSTLIFPWDFWLLSVITGRSVLSVVWVVFPKTETMSRTPVQSQSSVQRDDFGFGWAVRNWRLFLTHPTYSNKCMTSKNAQCSSRSGFRILNISHKIGVFKQSQPALFWQYYPHDNIVCTHMCDECKISIDSSVCHKLWSIL